ncbi:Sterigmatocystin biosynthesis regulatory protein [Diaporthe amygdali]|uniref:Sterigmatocystin biosynthesis regulatory protein n=1 Tax=Phomopsis amygdali TaxID=1214568 RepID=UPI0022FE2DB9|nr:Sterigmatocystin biosynthesis regulatory protein [Diaporthe amygdali]KAJ0113950.1 Sterigmatocystin biosynthesis regulatory protein [Diaporthe amygdali]
MSCVYGVSRKAGKPPRKRQSDASPLANTIPNPLPSRSSDPEAANVEMAAGGGGREAMNIDIMFSLGEDTMGNESPLSGSDAALQTWFPFDTFSGLGSLPGSSSDWDTCMSVLNGSPLKQVESPATTTSTSTSAAAAATTRHSCTQQTKEVMRRLYCANPSEPISDGLPARTLDLGSVLTRSSEVFGPLESLLRCPCARSPHMAMLYASILSRILLWYRQAAWNESSTQVSPSPSLFEPTLTGQGTTPSFFGSTSLKAFDSETTEDEGGVSVLPMPVMVGNFQSDDQNLQTAFTSCLILKELGRVGRLIETLISLGSGSADSQTMDHACPAAGDPSAGVADASLFASLGAWLRTEHGHIVRKARSGISMLDGNPRF